jgi:Cu-processing system permease protein
MSGFGAMVLNGFREARRNRVTIVVAVFTVVVLLSTSLVNEVTVNTFDRVLADFGLGTMSIILSFLAVFLSSGLLSREIERRTIFMIVSKPISRTRFLIARLLGNMLTLGVLGVAMFAIFLIELKMYRVPVLQVHLVAGLGLWFELLILSSAGVLFSTFSSQTVSAICTALIYFVGHLSGDIYKLANKASTGGVQLLGKALYFALPNLERTNFRPMATYGLEVSAGSFVEGAVYAVGYSLVLIALAAFIFERRDFK